MAFTGTPVVVKVTDRCFRITGVSLAAAAAGTIAFTGDHAFSPDVEIDAPTWQPYKVEGKAVSLQDAVKVEVILAGTEVGETASPVDIVKIGTTQADFKTTITDQNASEGAGTGPLEIYVTWSGHA